MSMRKNVLLNWYSSMKKKNWKIEKDSDNFWYRKLTLKVKRKRLGDFELFELFDTSPLTQFSRFDNFLWVCLFLGKNLSNFVPPVWKLHNPYCHSHQPEWYFSTLANVDVAKNCFFQKQKCFFHWLCEKTSHLHAPQQCLSLIFDKN